MDAYMLTCRDMAVRLIVAYLPGHGCQTEQFQLCGLPPGQAADPSLLAVTGWGLVLHTRNNSPLVTC